MKRGKDEEKIMGPMFPRLHVNDKEKGGPRAPPRNKMALYEQLSIVSQRFNPGVLPLNNNNTTDLVPPASSSQGSLHERSVFFPLHLPPSMPTHPPHSDSSTSLAQLEQRKKVGDEDDFRVPIFVHSGMGQCHSKNQNSIDGDRLTPLSPGCSMKLQNASDKESKRTSTAGVSSRQELRSQNEQNPRECVPIWNHSVKSSSNLSTRENLNGPLKQANASSNRECRDLPPDNFSRLHDSDASLQLKCRAGSQPEDTAPSDGVSVEPKGGIEKGNSSRPRKDYRSEECHSSHPDNDNEYCGNKTCGSLQGGNVDRGDDVSEASMVDSISGLDISPDDVVGIIGQKHFWKARRAIVNQQRVFAVQVFELHRLIKVQRLIAGSPHLLLEDNAYLGKPPLAVSPAKKLPLEYIVKPPPHNVKHKDDSEKPNHKMECYAENAVGKTSLSVHNGTQHSNYRPYSGNPPSTPVTTDTQMGPWCFNQPPGHQWLVPVMSPSEGLIYKPYPGSEFMGPVYGGCGPPGPIPMMGNFLNPAYGVPASHHHYQGIGVAPGAPPVGHGYFPPYGMPVMNPAISGSVVEQMNHLAGAGSQSQTDLLSGGGANFNNQSSCNMPSQNSGAIPNVVKFQASKDSELQGSTASSPSGQARGVGVHHIAEGRDALPLFPTAPVVCVSDGAPRETDHQTRVIKVVPHNPRSATESAARIFRSIQEERKQYDSI